MAGLNAKQTHVLKVALQGHNLVVCGQAGTGKSHVMRHVIHALQQCGKKVAVTATTGIASQQFCHQGATTLHSWAGLHDGRYSLAELTRLLRDDEKFREAAERIRQTSCLVVDEVSMLSCKMFELLQGVTSSVRNCSKPFGGIQLILAGDFYQLPPVKNAMSQEEGKFCFTSDMWKKFCPHTIQLTEILRQDEKTLVQAVNEAGRGFLSVESCQLLGNLKRPIQTDPGEIVVKLFATNQQVDVENTNCVIQIPGEVVTFHAEDEGDKKYLRSVMAPRTLHLKRNCPVMLLLNLSPELVNGSMGKVVDFGKEGPIVYFLESNKTLELKRIQFSVYNPQLRINVAVRNQIPIKPAFAMTIHKSQGMTLSKVIIDCHMINRSGQLGVAVGRAKSIAGIQILHFNQNSCVPQLDCVETFYDSVDSDETCLVDNLSCCNQSDMHEFEDRIERTTNTNIIPPELEHNNAEHVLEIDDINDEDLKEFADILEREVEVEQQYRLPEGYDIEGVITTSMVTPDHEPTEYQVEVNNILRNWRGSDALKCFLAWELRKIHDNVAKHLTPGEKAVQRELTALMMDYALFTQSQEHHKQCQYVTKSIDPSEFDYTAISRVITLLRKRELEEMAQSMPFPAKEIAVVRRLPDMEHLTDGARGKIRYVGGYCLAKMRYQYQQQTNRLIFRLDSPSRMRMMQSHNKAILLSSLMMTESQAQSFSEDKASLHATSRKQNINQGLSHIADTVNLFFADLCSEVINLQSDTNLNVHG